MSASQEDPKPRIVTLHMVSSLDGFIAKKDNSVAWLESAGSVYEAGASVSAEEAAAFVKAIDCYVMGSRTYEHALELGWVYGDTPVVVVSSREWPRWPVRSYLEHSPSPSAHKKYLLPFCIQTYLERNVFRSLQYLKVQVIQSSSLKCTT